MQIQNDDDFHGGQRSTEVKYSKQQSTSISTKLSGLRAKSVHVPFLIGVV